MRFLFLALGGLLPAIALAEPTTFAIPAEEADRALLDFSKQAGIELLFPFDALRRVRSNAVAGKIEPGVALDRLLQGTSFVAKQNDRGIFIVTARPKPAAPAASHAPAVAGMAAETDHLPEVVVKARSEANVSPTDTSLVAVGNLDLPRTENDALPFHVYVRDEITRSGAVNLDDFLRRQVLESDATQLPLDESGGQAGFLDGSTNLNLRAFGSDETLILVNGLPMPQMLSGGITNGSSTTSREADVNLIPLNLVERVEVLPVSAAALYSGNPVGGVINIVLRPIEDLTEITSTYSNGLSGVDAPQFSTSLLHGQTLLGGKLSFRFDAAFTRSTPATEAELGFIQANLAAHPDLNGHPIFRATPNIVSDNATPLFGPGTSGSTSVAPGATGTGGLAAFAGRQGVMDVALFQAPDGIASSPSSVNYAYGLKESSASYFTSATYDLSSRIQIGLNALYSHKVTNPGYDIFQGNLKLMADNPLNPFGQEVDVSLNETAPQLGEGYDEGHIDLYSAVAGALIRLPGDWRMSLDAQYSHRFTRYRGLAGVDSDRWQNLVDTGLYNPLRDTRVVPPPAAFYNQAVLFLGQPGKFLTLDNYQDVDAAMRVTDQDLHLPTGTGAVSWGGDFNLSHLASFNDNQYYGDGTLADTSGRWQGRTLQQYSGFGEVQLPLLPARWLPGWIQKIDLDAAARFNASNTAYGSNVAPAYGLKIALSGGWALRASVSDTNRFPTPTMSRFIPLPGGVGDGAIGAPVGTLVTDSLRGNSVYDVTSNDSPDVALRPEADVTESAGLIFQRGQVHKFRASVDVYDTRKSGELQYLDADDVLTYASYLPGRVTRAAAAPGDPYGVGPVVSIMTGNINLAWRHSENWNTSVDYEWTDCAGGTLQVYGRWVYFQRYDREVVPGSPTVDEIRHPDTTLLDLVKNRINFGAGWSGRKFGFGLDGQYFSPRILPTPLWIDQGANHIDSFCPLDGYVRSDLTPLAAMARSGSRLASTAQVRVDNLFSENLPKFAQNPTGTGVESYGDWRGQVYSFSLGTATF